MQATSARFQSPSTYSTNRFHRTVFDVDLVRKPFPDPLGDGRHHRTSINDAPVFSRFFFFIVGDPAIGSNAKKYNQNQTVLEWLNGQPELLGTVCAYCSWDVFPFIINDRRSRVSVNAGWSELTVGDETKLSALNFVAQNLFHEWDNVRYYCDSMRRVFG